MLRTLWIQNPAFVEHFVFQEANFVSVPGYSTSHTSGISRPGDKNQDFCSMQIFKHHASYLVPKSSAKIFLQKTRAGYNTLTACQNNYHPQEPQGTKGLRVQERAAEQLATHPIVPPTNLMTTKDTLESLKIKLPDGTMFNTSIFSRGNTRNTLRMLLLSYVSSTKRDAMCCAGS